MIQMFGLLSIPLLAESIGGQPPHHMPKFVIERDISGVGYFPPKQIKATSQKSCDVLKHLGPQIQWIQSYVTKDKIYCLYIAPDEATIAEHAKLAGLPANSVAAVTRIIDPTTAEY